ncbi:Integrase core domain protein (plasmid) [Piscirickettsia salmonis]|nr:Integrase core domain protein [Piscirickettsia salmonis]
MQEISKKKPNVKNRVPEHIEQAVIDLAIENPALGQLRASNELLQRGIIVSSSGVRSVWLRNGLETFKKRLKALEAKSAQDGILLTEEQLQALEKAKQEKEAHGENKFAQNSIYLSSQQATRYFGKLPLRVVMRFVFFRSKLRGIRPLAIETEHPGYLGSQDTYYVGTMKGVGRIYQQTFVDTYSRVAFACLYTEKNAVTAAHALNESVIPWLEERDTPLLRILTDRGTEYCGKIEHHAYQLYLAIEDVDHTRTKARSPQTNGICERFHRTMKQEFYDIAFRKKVYNSLEELQVDVDEWLIKYNQHRPHSGKYCYGKTPMQIFQDSKHLAQEKIINKNVQSDSLINQTNVVR